MTEELFLPKTKIPASTKSPNNLVIYSQPKAGKTTALSFLENNLILDLEGGSDFVEALKVKCNSIEDIKKYGEEIKRLKHPYKYISVDTTTALEDMIMPLAIKLYQGTPMGKNFTGESVLKLPNGAGYLYFREAFFKIIDYVKTLAPKTIFCAHLKEKNIDVQGKEVQAVDIDLVGKLKSLICSKADAVALLYRKGDQCILSFKTSEVVNCGARPEHLRNQEIVITEVQDGKIISHWDRVYID